MTQDIPTLEAARDEAHSQYVKASQELHAAYWDRLQEKLPEIIRQVVERYPTATVEAERTEWEYSNGFDHWVWVKFTEPMTYQDESVIYDWVIETFPSERGYSITVRSW